MSTAIQWLEKIQELHSPLVPPEGMALMGSKPGDQHCEGCEWNDPYEAVSWPCDTRKLADQALAELQPVRERCDVDNPFASVKTEEELFGVMAGAVSVCWEETELRGDDKVVRTERVFQAQEARGLVEAAIRRSKELRKPSFPEQIAEFMRIGDQLGTQWGSELDELELRAFRKKILKEEMKEYTDAEEDGDLIEVLDGLADIAYVAIGSLFAFAGVHQGMLILEEVAESNLSKFEDGVATKREDGKILKGKDYWEPDISNIWINDKRKDRSNEA